VLPKPHRLPLRFFRDQTNQSGSLISGPLFSLVVARPPERQGLPTRFSVIISKKVAANAVDRNRLRRQLLHHLARQLPQISPGFDAIILAKQSLTTASQDFVLKEIKRLLQRSALV